MNSLLENDDEFTRGDREVTLSAGAILGIFLGLALLCGLFFGFGYKMGSRKSAPLLATETSGAASAPAAPTADFSTFKPAAGSPAANSAPRSDSVAPESSESASRAAAAERPRPAPAADTSSALPGAPVASIRTGAPPATAVGGNFVVQVAAVSLQEDADLLVGALRSKGYTATEHAMPDKLIHIQVGPFANRKDADAMRQHLLADGYNAIVK